MPNYSAIKKSTEDSKQQNGEDENAETELVLMQESLYKAFPQRKDIQ